MNQFQSVGEVLAALRRRVLLMIAVILLGSALSLYIATQQVKTYETTAVVQIEESQVPDTLAGSAAQSQDAARRVQLIEQRLMSRDNLVRIMQEHQLFSDDPDMSLNERVFHMREAVRIDEIRSNPDAYAATQEAPSGLLISVTLGDPQKAADLANELMNTVIEQSRDRSVSRARETLDFFESEEARVEAEIQAKEAEVARFKQDNGDALPAGLGSLRDQLTTLRDNALTLDREIVALEANSSRQREEVLGRQIGLLREQKTLVENRIIAINETIQRAPEVERALSGLERELTRLQEQYNVITRRKAEAEMGQMLQDRQHMARFEVLETALVPEFAASGSRKKVLAMGVVASVIAGLAATFIAELMNPAIRSAAQMERALGVQPVVSIPTIRTRGERRITGMRLFSLLGLLFAAMWAALSSVTDWSALLGRFLPRAVRP
ncbi:chain-length determining protein [Salipiger aestuarii]|uniref:GumC family protein n=1 Tax=Salipiger aestuarii TaxID=568098 RepID=UPI00025B643B|nr:Wzz/FepE/Etk N-terminal domain-containing protein [Salipiger aestuarii]EIE51495.1 lipopolysaccharide biosynthesis [Citreicella sp. 357]KAA8608175.1 chain-length determining protein [Salipiger aestuarii]KAA8612240.1 chain-length determining protein [Salipiger aestuarii]